MSSDNYERFKGLTFEGFRRLANDDTLSSYEKVGFPKVYREGKEPLIFQDIVRKLNNLDLNGQVVLDIGPGCSGPGFMLIDLCRDKGHKLVLIDSPEMLNHLPDEAFIIKIPGYYPRDCAQLFEEYAGRINVVLTYSVLHCVFVEGNVYDFLDRSLSLLADGGQMLIGDIPNISKRKRFFSSPNGIRFHRQFTGTQETPTVTFNMLEKGQIDDAVILSIIVRCRQAGYDAYCLPQPADLPMANRREDILITHP